MPEKEFKHLVNDLRTQVKEVARETMELKKTRNEAEINNAEDREEVMANLTLAYRHLEDASMRLGKVLQANDGGVSVYDKETTVGA